MGGCVSALRFAFDENRLATFTFLISSVYVGQKMSTAFERDRDYDSPPAQQWIESLSPESRRKLDVALQHVQEALANPQVIEIASAPSGLNYKVGAIDKVLKETQTSGGRNLLEELMELGPFTLRVRQDYTNGSRGVQTRLLAVDLVRVSESP